MGTAIISDCGKYRYRLTRGKGRLLPVVMLNPSTSDASVDDPTIKRLLGFAKRGLLLCGYGGERTAPYDGIDVVNLYAYRAAMPCDLLSAADPFGPDNDKHLHAFCRDYGTSRCRMILGWGVHAEAKVSAHFLGVAACYITDPKRMVCFGHNLNGSPKHPLYLSYNAQLVPFLG